MSCCTECLLWGCCHRDFATMMKLFIGRSTIDLGFSVGLARQL